jgi:hypothetical protein
MIIKGVSLLNSGEERKTPGFAGERSEPGQARYVFAVWLSQSRYRVSRREWNG